MKIRLIAAALFVLGLLSSQLLARTWTDSTGKYTIEADFVELKGGAVHLKKAGGKIIDVPLGRLSKMDREWVQRQVSRQAEADKRAPAKKGPATSPKQEDEKKPANVPATPVTIGLADGQWLGLSQPQGPFGPSVGFQLACTNRGVSDKSATVVCELEYETKEGKTALETLSFHTVELARGDSKIDVEFFTVGMSLSGSGTLKVYLIREITVKPEPPHLYSMLQKSMIYMLDKHRIKQYDDLQAQIGSRVISNVLRIPAAADAAARKRLEAKFGPTSEEPKADKPTPEKPGRRGRQR